MRLSLEHCIPIPLCLQTTAKVLEDTRALYSKDSKSLSTPAGKYAAHHLLLLAGIQRSNAGILLADTETSEGRMIAEIQDSLANPDKPLMRACIELCEALSAGGRKKDRLAKAQRAFAEAWRGVIMGAPSRIESSNAAFSALERVHPDHDIWIGPEFAQTVLNVDPKKLQDQLEQNYPVRRKGDPIEWAKPQWVEGDNEALHYRGHKLKRGKMWCQAGDPKTEGFVKYFYTGWQRAVLPATCDVERVPELSEVVERYNTWATGDGHPVANHFIVTHYVDGEHNIGMHFDKPNSIRTGSLITIVKTGEYGRPFRIEMLDGTVLMDKVLAPGTAVIMTLEANLKTKHGVLAVAQAGSSGSIVFRTITERVGWADLESELKKKADV